MSISSWKRLSDFAEAPASHRQVSSSQQRGADHYTLKTDLSPRQFKRTAIKTKQVVLDTSQSRERHHRELTLITDTEKLEPSDANAALTSNEITSLQSLTKPVVPQIMNFSRTAGSMRKRENLMEKKNQNILYQEKLAIKLGKQRAAPAAPPEKKKEIGLPKRNTDLFIVN